MPIRNHRTYTATARAITDAEDSKALVAALRDQLAALDDHIKDMQAQKGQSVEVLLDTDAILEAITRLEAILTRPRQVQIDIIRNRAGLLESVVARTITGG